MKRLTVTYGDSVLCDSDQVGQLQLSETGDGISVTATFRKPVPARRPTTGSGAGGLLTMLATAGKAGPPQRRPEPAAPVTEDGVG